MEMGDQGQQQQQQQQRWRRRQQQRQQQPQPQLQRNSSAQRVTVAALEMVEQEDNNRESAARSARLLARVFNVGLLGLVAGFGCFFAYVWVDSFRKVRAFACSGSGCGSHGKNIFVCC